MNALWGIEALQFMEELLGGILDRQHIAYSPMSDYDAPLGFVYWPCVLDSVWDVFELMSRRYQQDIEEIIVELYVTSKTREFFERIGRYLLIERPFEWKNFRVFLALACKVADLCFQNEFLTLSDDVIFAAANFIEVDLEYRIDEIMDWRGFEEDCLKTVLEMEKLDAESKERMLDELEF